MTSTASAAFEFARALRDKAKLSPERAEGFADAMAEALEGDIARKGDLLETELRLKNDIEGVKTDIESSKADIIKWMFGTIGFQTIIILGAAIALARIVSK